MIADLKPYSEYSPAEGGWLGEISKYTATEAPFTIGQTIA